MEHKVFPLEPWTNLRVHMLTVFLINNQKFTWKNEGLQYVINVRGAVSDFPVVKKKLVYNNVDL